MWWCLQFLFKWKKISQPAFFNTNYEPCCVHDMWFLGEKHKSTPNKSCAPSCVHELHLWYKCVDNKSTWKSTAPVRTRRETSMDMSRSTTCLTLSPHMYPILQLNRILRTYKLKNNSEAKSMIERMCLWNEHELLNINGWSWKLSMLLRNVTITNIYSGDSQFIWVKNQRE